MLKVARYDSCNPTSKIANGLFNNVNNKAIEIVVYVIAILIGAFSYAGNPLVIYKSVSLVASILYFVVMTIFGYLIARRFNKKLFKFSVAKTFKEVA